MCKILNISVSIIPIGDPEPKDVEYLAEQLMAKCGNCVVGDRIDMPAGVYSPIRMQYMASLLLQKLLEAYSTTPPGTKLLGVTNADLYVPGLEYVSGQAELKGQGAVISLKRLYGVRMVKVAFHEIGHTLGLQHCEDSFCVMHYSRYGKEIDTTSDRFCRRCTVKLDAAIN